VVPDRGIPHGAAITRPAGSVAPGNPGHKVCWPGTVAVLRLNRQGRHGPRAAGLRHCRWACTTPHTEGRCCGRSPGVRKTPSWREPSLNAWAIVLHGQLARRPSETFRTTRKEPIRSSATGRLPPDARSMNRPASPGGPSRGSGAEVCPLPARIALSYLMLWPQRSRSHARLPGGCPPAWRRRATASGQVLRPIYRPAWRSAALPPGLPVAAGSLGLQPAGG
jgi:hypothetical protein